MYEGSTRRAAPAPDELDLKERFLLHLEDQDDVAVERLRFPRGVFFEMVDAGVAQIQVRDVSDHYTVLSRADELLEGPTKTVGASIPRALLEAVRARADRGDFSRYVAHALVDKLKADALHELSEELQRTHPSDPKDVKAALLSLLT